METPNRMSAHSKGGTVCAFDNFDRFVESESGKDTLHDTVIMYESFLEIYENAEDIRSLILRELRVIKEQKHLDKLEWSQEIEELLAAYKSTQWKLAMENGGKLQTTG